MMKVRRQSDGHILGGWAAEYKGHGTDQLVRKVLHEDLDGMFKRFVDILLHTRLHDWPFSQCLGKEHSAFWLCTSGVPAGVGSCSLSTSIHPQ